MRNIGLDKQIKTPKAAEELMKLAVSAPVYDKSTPELGEMKLMEQIIIPKTLNLGGDIGSTNAPMTDSHMLQQHMTFKPIAKIGELQGPTGQTDSHTPQQHVITQMYTPQKSS